ncbi:DUF4280 domain-containing protein [Paenibacillus radicis (ex Gao et al. 2016)]|uniref:DUF4280 domain-containing protein n=1 Tax=Paenibacillus radicis (ex Gao et al. 2016) TaxID=1737354 RepID=A0A917HM57_9BACL|nr:DUF4280 domain-containing protein [Paenibacillus radicis (ex Gao et al. 2016)]GGG82882.1 hypothetical protein GCM10010918_45500 [Paenibacillus radicis (ex Gao et al. 2016)]
MGDESGYVVRGAKMQCSFGSNFRRINLPQSHGAYVNDKPMMNESDRMPVENIAYFGVCSSVENDNTEVLYLFGKDGAPVNGKRCCPVFLDDWLLTKADALVDGKPALTTKSQLICMHDGVITFVDDGQHSD